MALCALDGNVVTYSELLSAKRHERLEPKT
jgi:hypothetical protein